MHIQNIFFGPGIGKFIDKVELNILNLQAMESNVIRGPIGHRLWTHKAQNWRLGRAIPQEHSGGSCGQKKVVLELELCPIKFGFLSGKSYVYLLY